MSFWALNSRSMSQKSCSRRIPKCGYDSLAAAVYIAASGGEPFMTMNDPTMAAAQATFSVGSSTIFWPFAIIVSIMRLILR